jgi:hypothetical protein
MAVTAIARVVHFSSVRRPTQYPTPQTALRMTGSDQFVTTASKTRQPRTRSYGNTRSRYANRAPPS